MTEQPSERRRVDRGGFTSAHATPDGRVHLDLWTEGRRPTDDPAQFSMSPGQALTLIQKLADAAQRALTEATKA